MRRHWLPNGSIIVDIAVTIGIKRQQRLFFCRRIGIVDSQKGFRGLHCN